MTIIDLRKNLVGRGGTIAIIAAFWTWCVLLSFPLIGTTYDVANLHAEFGSDSASLMWQIAGLALFVIAVSLADPTRLLNMPGRFGYPQIAVLAIILLSLVLQLHDDERSILAGTLYTCIFLISALSLSVLWTMAPADLEMCMIGAAAILCCFGITALAVLGIPEQRDVGGIQPNLFAIPLLAGFIFSQFHAGIMGAVVRLLCIAMIALVSSRFALIGGTLAFVLYHLTFEPLRRGKLFLLLLASVVSIPFWPEIAAILALDDPTRGLGSGASGRDELWYGALTTITDNPFGIGFKRTLGNESGHNGYLKTILEFGVVGGGLIVVFFGCNLVTAAIDAVGSAGLTRQERRFASARLGGLVALLFGAFFQPQLFNFGDVFGMSVLFFFFRPNMNRRSRTGFASAAAPSPYLRLKTRPAKPEPGKPAPRPGSLA